MGADTKLECKDATCDFCFKPDSDNLFLKTPCGRYFCSRCTKQWKTRRICYRNRFKEKGKRWSGEEECLVCKEVVILEECEDETWDICLKTRCGHQMVTIGQKVIIVDLQDDTEYNSTDGKIVDYESKRGMWGVKLSGGSARKVDTEKGYVK